MPFRRTLGLRRGTHIYTQGDGYFYKSVVRNNVKAHFTCYRNDCNSRVWVQVNTNNAVVNDNFPSHNHPPEPLLEDSVKLRMRIISRVEKETLPLKEIFDEECSKVPKELSKDLDYPKMESSLYKARKKGPSEHSQSADEFGSLWSFEEFSEREEEIEKETFKEEELIIEDYGALSYEITTGDVDSEKTDIVKDPQSDIKGKRKPVKFKEENLDSPLKVLRCQTITPEMFKKDPMDITNDDPKSEPGSLTKASKIKSPRSTSENDAHHDLTPKKKRCSPKTNGRKKSGVPVSLNTQVVEKSKGSSNTDASIPSVESTGHNQPCETTKGTSDDGGELKTVLVSLQGIPLDQRAAAKDRILELANLFSNGDVDPASFKLIIVQNQK